MPYIGRNHIAGDHTSNFKVLDDISSYTATFNGSSALIISTTDNTIRIPEHRFIQGQRLTYSNGGGGNIGGLTNGTAYFVTFDTANTIKLATSLANANNNTNINLSSVGSGSAHTLTAAFDGINTTFKITHGGGSSADIVNSAQLQVAINNVIQKANLDSSYTEGFLVVDSRKIQFKTAPTVDDIFWGNIIANTIETFDIADLKIDQFTGDGTTTQFTLSRDVPNNQSVMVTLDGVVQHPSDKDTTRAYRILAEKVIEFSSPPPNPCDVQVRHLGFAGASTGDVSGFYGRTGNVVLGASDHITTGDITPRNINASGIVTASSFSGGFSGNIVGTSATFTGNLSVGGVLTYEDVTNVDSVGIITAQKDIHVGAGVSVVGIVTAATFKGDGDFVDIDVDGHTNLDNVSIAGVTTSYDALHIKPSGSANSTNVVPLEVQANKGSTTTGITTVLYQSTYAIRPEFILSNGHNGNWNNSNGQTQHWRMLWKAPNEADTTDEVVELKPYTDIGGALSSFGIRVTDNSTGLKNSAYFNSQQITLYANNTLGFRLSQAGIGITDTIYHEGDTDTKIRFPANDTIRFETAGSQRLNINSSGNVSITNDLDVDGHTNLDNVSIAGVTTFSSDLNVAENIIHTGDTDTKIRFTNDVIQLQGGGTNRIQTNNIGARIDTTLLLYGDAGNPGRLRLQEGGALSEIMVARNSDTNSFLYFKTEISGTTATRVMIDESGHFRPNVDSTNDLGINGTRWRNVYADTYYGNGSNLTGIDTDLVSDTSPQLGGTLDGNGQTANFTANNTGLGIPIGTDANEPSAGSYKGYMRFNDDDDIIYYSDGTSWKKISAEIAILSSISGNIFVGSTTNLTLTGTGFLSANLVVNFVQSSDGINTNVTVTPTNDTSATVAVPAAVYNNVSNGNAVTIKVTNSDGSTSGTVNVTAITLPTGGSIYSSGGYRYHKFTSSGTFTQTLSRTVEYLIVAGGGAGGGSSSGGNRLGGGGGAGGLRGGSVSTTPQGYTITIGAGGSGVTSNTGNSGSSSSAFGITSIGGGGGGSGDSGSKTGGNGGSGGGAGRGSTGGSGTSGQGYPGGNALGSSNPQSQGGGGGAGGPGTDGDTNAQSGRTGNGGVGSNAYSAWASATSSGHSGYYAGGGGSGWHGSYYSTTRALGGNGGGGNGGDSSSDNSNAYGFAGTANTGGGGGGNSTTSPHNAVSGAPNGPAGGSGIVIIRYQL